MALGKEGGNLQINTTQAHPKTESGGQVLQTPPSSARPHPSAVYLRPEAALGRKMTGVGE